MRFKEGSILLSIAVLLLACSGGQEYEQVLDRAHEQNQNYENITGIDSIQKAGEYYDRHGSANEQVRAHYLLGCAYRDAEEAMKALEAYHDAIDRADTTSKDCDYNLLLRVHGQSVEIFKKQLLPYEMLDELEAQRICALKAGDIKNAINALERTADAYYLLNKPDSIIAIRLRASKMYEQQGFYEEAAQALGPVIEPLIDKGDIDEAKRCMIRYESSKNFFVDGEIIPRKAVHYYSKGKYCLAVGKTDSAGVYFRRLLEPGRTPQQKEAGYRGLFLLFKQIGQKDSLAKYADLLFLESLPVVEAVNTDNLQQIQGLYNYTRSQKEAEQMREKATKQKTILIILVCVSIILLLIVWGIHKHHQWERRQLQLEYESLLHEYEKEKACLANAQFLELEGDIRQHQQKIEELERNLTIIMQRPSAQYINQHFERMADQVIVSNDGGVVNH